MIEQRQRPGGESEDLPISLPKTSPLTMSSMRDGTIAIGPMLPEDTAALFVWLNDVEAAILDFHYRPVDWMNYHEWLENFRKNPSQVLFAVRCIHGPRLLGFVTFTRIDSVHRSAELSIRIGSETDRGRGYGKAAIQLALSYAWKHLNLHRVQLSVFGFNSRAIAAYQAAGFQIEGRLRQAAFINGDWTEVVLMGILHS